MRTSTTSAHRIVFGALAAGVLGAAAASGAIAPAADAQPEPCTAGELATTASGVLNEAGSYLGTHPEANSVLTTAASQAPDDARNSVRGYFTAHVGELMDLQRIAQPLSDLKNQCGVALSPSHLATLIDAITG